MYRLSDYISNFYSNSVPLFASSLGLSESAVYRMIKNRADSSFVIYIDGLPKLVDIRYSLQPLPSNCRFDFHNDFFFMFRYAEQDYYVERHYDSSDSLQLTCTRLGGDIGLLNMDFEFDTVSGLGLMQFSLKHSPAPLFDVYFNSGNHYWTTPCGTETFFLDFKGAKLAFNYTEMTFSEVIHHCIDTSSSFFVGEQLIFKGIPADV